MDTITVTKRDLVAALRRVRSGIERRNTIPVLGCVALRAEVGTLWLDGTNLDVAITTHINGTGGYFEQFAVPIYRLMHVLSRFSEGEIELGRDGFRLIIRSAFSRAAIAGMEWNDYVEKLWQSPPDTPAPVCIEFPAGVLQATVRSMLHAISTESTRYCLNGIYCHPEGGAPKFVATNGHMMELRTVRVAAGEFPGIIVPRETFGPLLAAGKGEVRMAVHAAGNRVAFSTGDTVIMSKTIDGTFPDYKRVLPPETFDVEAPIRIVASAALLQAAITPGYVSDTSTNVLVPVGDGLEVRWRDSEACTRAGAVPGGTMSGPEVSFNGSYLVAILAGYGVQRVTMEAADGGSPMRIRGETADALSILMPMRASYDLTRPDWDRYDPEAERRAALGAASVKRRKAV